MIWRQKAKHCSLGGGGTMETRYTTLLLLGCTDEISIFLAENKKDLEMLYLSW